MPSETIKQLHVLLGQLITSIVRDELTRANQPRQDEYLSVREAAAFARVSPGTLRRWIGTRLTRHGAGREIRILKSELEGVMRPDEKRQTPRVVDRRKKKELSPEEAVLALL